MSSSEADRLWSATLRFQGHPVFAAVRSGIDKIGPLPAFPSVAQLDGALAPGSGVRFEVQYPKPRRSKARVLAHERYNGRITEFRCVPTRENSLHDLFNALVWESFPLAKAALHKRQHAAQGETGNDRGVWTRTREQDALSLLDEGGVLLCGLGVDLVPALLSKDLGYIKKHATPLVFGHALHEYFIRHCDGPEPLGGLRAMSFPLPCLPVDADRALMEILEDPGQLLTPPAWDALPLGGLFS